jgi:hypothetical protein
VREYPLNIDPRDPNFFLGLAPDGRTILFAGKNGQPVDPHLSTGLTLHTKRIVNANAKPFDTKISVERGMIVRPSPDGKLIAVNRYRKLEPHDYGQDCELYDLSTARNGMSSSQTTSISSLVFRFELVSCGLAGPANPTEDGHPQVENVQSLLGRREDGGMARRFSIQKLRLISKWNEPSGCDWGFRKRHLSTGAAYPAIRLGIENSHTCLVVQTSRIGPRRMVTG